MLLKALICWPLLAIAFAAILCRLIHKAKIADRALGIQLPDHQFHPRNVHAQTTQADDPDRRAA